MVSTVTGLKSDRQHLSSLRLGVITGTTGARHEKGGVMLSFALGRYLEALREQIPNTTVCLPILAEQQRNMNHALQYPKVAIVALPPLRNTIEAQPHFLKTRRILHSFAQSVDLLLVRLPFQIPRCLIGLDKPKLLHIVSNPYEVVRASSDYHGVMKLLARGYGRHMNATFKRLVAEPGTRTVTHGKEIWGEMQCAQGRIVVSSGMYESEMKPRSDFLLHDPPRLLFVGYLRPEKGVDTLLDAFTIIRRKRPIRLTVAGGSDRATKTEQLIRERIQRSEYRADIEIMGMLDYGEELFDLYRRHDIYVLSSWSEGTPRTLVEARALGCPVVATRVGGVPSSVTDGKDGLLVEPGNAQQMAAAIERLLDDARLRVDLIQGGLQRARTMTLETSSARSWTNCKFSQPRQHTQRAGRK